MITNLQSRNRRQSKGWEKFSSAKHYFVSWNQKSQLTTFFSCKSDRWADPIIRSQMTASLYCCWLSNAEFLDDAHTGRHNVRRIIEHNQWISVTAQMVLQCPLIDWYCDVIINFNWLFLYSCTAPKPKQIVVSHSNSIADVDLQKLIGWFMKQMILIGRKKILVCRIDA